MEALPEHGGDPSGWDSPEWSPSSAIAFMDSQGIATGILSLTAPGVVGWCGVERREMARRVNDYAAGLVAKRPDRFGNLATLPLPDIEGSLREIDYAFSALRCDGAVVLSNYDGAYLGDRRYEPVWAELDRREAVVFIHPTKPNIPVLAEVPGPIVDYPFDTTRTAVHMVVQGVLHRYRRVRFILPHAGGFLPYTAHRFAELTAAVRPSSPTASELLESFKRFMFDTALSSGPATLPSFSHSRRGSRAVRKRLSLCAGSGESSLRRKTGCI